MSDPKGGGVQVGLPSLAVDAAGVLYIGFMTLLSDTIYSAHVGTLAPGSAWQVETIDEKGAYDPSVVVDSKGGLHAAYLKDADMNNLRRDLCASRS